MSNLGDDEACETPLCPPSPAQKEEELRRIGVRKNINMLTTSSPTSDESLLDKLHHLEHLDIDSEASSSSSSSLSSSGISSMYSNSLGSTFLPPPEYYLPQASQQSAQPFRQVLRWQVSLELLTLTHSLRHPIIDILTHSLALSLNYWHTHFTISLI
jgi:hypothetical protein